jgi:hypothetical protein
MENRTAQLVNRPNMVRREPRRERAEVVGADQLRQGKGEMETAAALVRLNVVDHIDGVLDQNDRMNAGNRHCKVHRHTLKRFSSYQQFEGQTRAGPSRC